MVTIDIHTHFFAEELMKKLDRSLIDSFGEEATIRRFYESEDLGLSMERAEERIELMDKWGLEKAVLSFPSPRSFIEDKYLKDPEFSVEFSRAVNDYLKKARDSYEDRIFAFASIPKLDNKKAIEELERAVKSLSLQGVEIDSNIFGNHLASKKYRPFFTRADELGVPIYIHPTSPLGSTRMDRFYTDSMIGFPFETTLTATYMIFSGFLEKYNNLNIILSHVGGALPFLKRRLEFLYHKKDPEFKRNLISNLRKEPVEYLEDFWFDTAMSFPRAIQMTLDEIGNRLIFGSDYPFGPKKAVEDTMKQIRELEISKKEVRKIRELNAKKILLNC
ncbi:hypothetical protein AKJ38_03485 [candidate division MSBL1 archaeon SCGC-AAA259I14]|uniref:Amidohydrolase-related domain-containing protein n=1 Tax=candidate division MSBL1 archaeon SCGC-AAA259I14 TaxID=1698268 RepID=A0A133UQ24_9EURY|nr:hypothetical protein AKJ38_03485 [candidate division MSBL1 archaeon SCGC-AAA259I14]